MCRPRLSTTFTNLVLHAKEIREVKGMSGFAAEGVDFNKVFAVRSNPNDVVFDVCCRVRW